MLISHLKHNMTTDVLNITTNTTNSGSYGTLKASARYWDTPEDEQLLLLEQQQQSSALSKFERLYGPYDHSLPVPLQSEHKKPFSTKSGNNDNNDEEKTTLFWDLPIDYRDVHTPDDWIPRDGRLVRLTGKHPMNACLLLQEHMQDFLTPQHLHFVRNHGVTPKCTWESHVLNINHNTTTNNNKNSTSNNNIAMNALIAIRPCRELPVTLVSAALRRSEFNAIQSTLGVGWGIGGVGTAVYKGVLVKTLLMRNDFKSPLQLATFQNKWVEFVGKEDLPNPNMMGQTLCNKGVVKYTKYLPFSYVWNDAYDVIVAYLANGQPLLPDHGYPVRLIVPGCVAGYSVKWLTEINIVDAPKGPFHFHEHLLFPPTILTSSAITDFYNREYIQRLVNINSTMISPAHLESWSIVHNMYKKVELSGYAISGGGVAVSRVEVSWDCGTSWHLANLRRPEQPTLHDKYWCWTLWSLEVPVLTVVRSTELWCRAWDQAFHVQPTLPTWNILGVAANHVYKIRVTKDQFNVYFQHPTGVGGWMNSTANQLYSAGFGPLIEFNSKDDDEYNLSIEAVPNGPFKKFTMTQVGQHNTNGDVWIVVRNRVFDCTEYLQYHPGGIESIIINGGQDATDEFIAIHSKRATKMLSRYYIGDLVEEADEGSVVSNCSSMSMSSDHGEYLDDHGSPIALHPKKTMEFRLQKKIVLSDDSVLLDFALQSPKHVLGLPTGKHILISAEINGVAVNRRYTPVSSNHDLGRVQFVVKIYRPTPTFPKGGKMSQYLSNLIEGDMLKMRGPVGSFEYVTRGRYTIEGHDGYCTKINMIAGGSGISPIMQIAAHILRRLEDNTEMTLIYACRQESDIMLRSALDQWQNIFFNKFRVHYILSDSWPHNWEHSTGFINKELMEEHLFPASDDVLNVMCGPPVMLEKGCIPNLVKLGHHPDRIHSF